MKRTRSESKPEDPSKIRSSFVRGFHGVRNSENRFGPETSRGTKADGPKTSEYAFFKKLKKDVGRVVHSYPVHKEGNQLEKLESSDYTREMDNMVRHSFKNLKSSLLVENVTPINLDLFPTPLGGPSKNSEMTNMVKHNSKNHKSSLIFEEVTPINLDPFPSATGGPAKNSGFQYWHEEVFSTKRQRLRQWAADTLSPGIDELCLKGYDLVSVLLNRMFPERTEGNENNCCRDPKYKQAEIDTRSELLAFPESDPKSDAEFKKLHWTITNNFMEPEHMPCMDDRSVARWSNSFRKVVLSKWESIGCDSPTICANKTHLQYKIRELDCDLDGGRTARLCTESDSAFDFSFEKYRSLASNHLKELHEFYDSSESAIGRKPHNLLLGWNFDDMKDEQGLSITSHNHNTDLSLYPTLPTSWCDDQWQSLDNRFDVSRLCFSSYLSNHPPNLTSSPHFHSSSYCNLDFERHVLEDKKDLGAALNHFPLTLSCTPSYLNRAEDCNYDTTCRGSSIFPSPQNDHWFLGKDFSQKCHPCLESLLVSAGLDFDIGQQCSLITDSSLEHQSCTYDGYQFCPKEGISSYFLPKDEFGSLGETLDQYTKDILNIHRPSISFQISLDEDNEFPLLLDKSSWDEGETYTDDSDVKYI